MPTDSFTSALAQLDPANRALLDLSLRRGMRPEEISDLLGTDPESVIVAREQALEHLAKELGLDDVSELDEVRARLAELPPESWTGSRAPLPQVEAIMDEPEPEPAPAPEREPEKQQKSRLPLLLALLAVAALVLVVVLASGGSDSNNVSPTPSNTPAPPKAAAKAAPGKPTRSAPKPAPASTKVPLTAIGGGGARGTANLLDGGKRLRLDVTGLPAGSYQVWLYDSIIDAHSLAKANGPALSVNVKLPANASHFKYLDISREPADGNPNHSGISVLRVPLAKLSP